MSNNQRKSFYDMLLDNWWLRHILFWVIYMVYFTWGMYMPVEINKPSFFSSRPLFEFIHNKPYIISALKYIPGFILVVYVQLYYLIPKFLIHKKFLQFIVGYILLIGVACVYVEIFNLNFASQDTFDGFAWKSGKNVLPFVHVSAVASMMKMMRYAFLQERREHSNKFLRTLAELELLKAQIHPHFLFNTLNNLFAHTLKKSPDSGKIVLKLSDLLRFMVYESREDKILLEKEISLLTDYIELEKLRYGKDLDVSVKFSGDIEGKKIRPLLLLPLVENSFKHGTSQQLNQKWISLNLHVTGNTMQLNLENSRDAEGLPKIVPGKTIGIGIVNVRRRLEILYPNAYEFRTIPEKDRFIVQLKLDLSVELQETQYNREKNLQPKLSLGI